MRDLRVGIVACGAMLKEIEICAGQMENTCNVYALIPSCAFTINIDLFRDRLKKSIRENDVTLLAYGLCHPGMNSLLREYDASVKRLAGCCCYEMILGAEKYAEYHKKCFWMLQKPFFTKWRGEVEGGFGIGNVNGRQLVDENFKKLLYVKFEHDDLDPDVVRKFSDKAGLDYEVYNADLSHLSVLLKEAVSALPHVWKGSPGTRTVQDAGQTEWDQILGCVDEIVYKVDLHDKSFFYVSPQVERILGYTKGDFMDVVSGHIQGEFYDERDKNRVITSRYDYIARCLLGNVGKYEVEYRARDASGRALWIMETMNPVYNKKEPVIGCFVGTLRDITKHKRKENNLQTTIHLLKEKLTKTRGVLKRKHVHLKNTMDSRLVALDYQRDSEEKYRIIADFAYDWEYWLGPDGNYLYVSPSCERLTGFSSHEFMTDPDLMLRITHPEDRSRVAAHLDAVKCIGADENQMEFRIITRAGGECWIDHQCQDVYARDGAWIGRRGSNRDISDKKKAGEALQKSKEQFDMFLKHCPDPLYIKDADTRAIALSSHFEEILGKPLSQLLGKTNEELWPPELAAAMRADDEKVMKERCTIEREETFEGQHYWSVKFPIFITNLPTMLGGFTVNITARKLEQEALKKSEEMFNKAFHSSPILRAISMVEDGRFLDVNEVFLRTLFFSKEEVIGKTSLELGLFANPTERQTIKKNVEEKGYVKNIEVQIVAKNGQIIDGLFSAESLTINNEKCWFTVMVDVTEQKLALEALRRSEESYRSIFENASDAIFIAQDGLFRLANSKTLAMSGYTFEELLNSPFIDLVHPDDRTLAMERLQAKTKGESPPGYYTFRIINKNGDIRLVTADGVIISKEKKPEILVFVRDVTEQESLREAIIRSERLSALGMLSAGIAHELRNPLAIISSCSQFCLEKKPPPDLLADNFQRIYRNAIRANALVNDLLDFARPTQLKRKLVNIHDVLEGILVVALRSNGTSTVPVTYQTIYAKELLFIIGDEDALTRVFLNIFNNAIHVGRHILIETHHIASRNEVRVDITDDGPGIPEENRNRVFDPFFTTKKGGTGLGLSISHTIVREHGGTIEVLPGGKVGTTFSVILPVAPKGSNASLQEHLEKSARQSKPPEEKKK